MARENISGTMKVKTRLAMIPVLVKDQDEALHFYTEKLGLEKRCDLSFGPGLRLLTVAQKGQKRPEIALVDSNASMVLHCQQPGMLANEHETRWMFRTDNCRDTYESWRARGINFLSGPIARSYGIEAIFADPYGNTFSLLEPSRAARPLLRGRTLGTAA
jgi:catechol 2,3-dioxygenase-like lactoylglutathione lyase family enzyme